MPCFTVSHTGQALPRSSGASCVAARILRSQRAIRQIPRKSKSFWSSKSFFCGFSKRVLTSDQISGHGLHGAVGNEADDGPGRPGHEKKEGVSLWREVAKLGTADAQSASSESGSQRLEARALQAGVREPFRAFQGLSGFFVTFQGARPPVASPALAQAVMVKTFLGSRASRCRRVRGPLEASATSQ